jgi:Mechanosensitive ion channel
MTKQHLGSAIAAVGAAVAVGVGYHFGGELKPHTPDLTQHQIVAKSAAAVFVALGIYTSRRLANELGRAIAQSDRASASVVRLILTIAGVLVVALVTLAMLRIGVSQLLLGGAITGVVLGIAAQQSLGNMFAGIVLLVARPFRAGDRIRVKTGSLGGAFEGEVISMGLTYVTFTAEEGTTLVPNLTLLASGIVRSPRPLPAAPPGSDVVGPAAGSGQAAGSGPPACPPDPPAASGPPAGSGPPACPPDPPGASGPAACPPAASAPSSAGLDDLGVPEPQSPGTAAQAP